MCNDLGMVVYYAMSLFLDLEHGWLAPCCDDLRIQWINGTKVQDVMHGMMSSGCPGRGVDAGAIWCWSILLAE